MAQPRLLTGVGTPRLTNVQDRYIPEHFHVVGIETRITYKVNPLFISHISRSNAVPYGNQCIQTLSYLTTALITRNIHFFAIHCQANRFYFIIFCFIISWKPSSDIPLFASIHFCTSCPAKYLRLGFSLVTALSTTFATTS